MSNIKVFTGTNNFGPLSVSDGGTGATSLTDGGILLGSGTGPITALGVATNGQIPIGDGTGDPVLATITGTSGRIDVTNGAGSITLDTPAILGDGTDGRVVRFAFLEIDDGTNANTISCRLRDDNNFNGDDISTEDNLGKSGSTTNFSLNASGNVLTIEASGLTGNCVGVISNLRFNFSGTEVSVTANATSNDIVLTFAQTPNGSTADLTSLMDTGVIQVDLFYITDA